MCLAHTMWFLHFLQGPFAQFVGLNPEFQVMATTVTSMATKSSDLEDQTSGANLQTEGHTPIPSRGQKDPEEMGALGSAPSHLPSWSLARELSPSYPNTRHCLGIHVTLTKGIGAVPPPPHTYMAPMVEDMLCHGRTGLTKAVVKGPGWAILFYGRWSLGEGLSLGELRDTMFTLTGVGTWVGKPAYLATNPLTIHEGQWNNYPGHHRMPDRGKRARVTMLTSVDPATIQIPLFRGFSPKRPPQRYQFWPSTIAPQATERPGSQSA